jgi:hypothetical protein
LNTKLQALSKPSDISAGQAVEYFADKSHHQRSLDALAGFKVQMERHGFGVEAALLAGARYKLLLEQRLAQLGFLDTALRDGALGRLRYWVVDLDTGREVPENESEVRRNEAPN